MQAQHDIQIEKEVPQVSVFDGFARVGGFYTLINGVFAAIFGSTLLRILFGV